MRLALRSRVSALTLCLLAAGATALVACGDDDAAGQDAVPQPSTPDTGGDDTSGGSEPGEGSAPGEGSEPAPDDDGPTPLAPPADGCPTLAAGTVSWHDGTYERKVDVFLPATISGNLSLLFLWHGAGDSAANFARALGPQAIANRYNSVVVLPHNREGASAFGWPIFRNEKRTSDLGVFDSVTACAIEQHGVNPRRVYTSGFSAGALWSTYLVMQRADSLASAVLFSGGVNTSMVSYETPAYPLPVLAIHGGDSDVVAIANFGPMTEELVDKLVADGHVAIVCNHDRGHTIPFLPDTFAWPFLFSHTWGEESTYGNAPLDETWPAFCSIAR